MEARCYPLASDLGAHSCVQEEIDTGTVLTRICSLSRRFTQNRRLKLPSGNSIVPATSLEDTQWSFFFFFLKQVLQLFPFSYYYNQETVDLLIPADWLNRLALDFSF